jgi:hypothetical protein
MKKSYNCFKTDPDSWLDVKEMGLRLLSLPDLTHYRRLLPVEEDLQNEWGTAVSHRGKYVNLLVGQLNDDEIRVERDEENHCDEEPHARVTKNYFLAYHQVMAHERWVASRPEEAESLRRFQVRTCV